jgi:hypothetical protein
MKSGPQSICLALLICCSVACVIAQADPKRAAAPKTLDARAWLAALPPLPVSADEAYAQWTDISGNLKPGPAQEKITEDLKTQVMTLQRPLEPAPPGGGPILARDQQIAARITPFPDTAGVQQKIQAARTHQASLEQKWHAEAGVIEQRRLQERSALPACHNETGVPSQLAIREVEENYARQKIALAEHYLAEFRPLVDQLQSAVGARIEHGDEAFAAWLKLRNAGLRTQLAPLARASQSAALLDVGTVQAYVQEISKLAARPVADKRALERVYAQAKGC